MFSVKALYFATAGTVALAVASPAYAGPSATQFLSFLRGSETERVTAEVAIASSSQAYTVANAELRLRGEKPLFCVPDRLSITADQASQIVRKFVADRPEVGTLAVEIVLLGALKNTFPC